MQAFLKLLELFSQLDYIGVKKKFIHLWKEADNRNEGRGLDIKESGSRFK